MKKLILTTAVAMLLLMPGCYSPAVGGGAKSPPPAPSTNAYSYTLPDTTRPVVPAFTPPLEPMHSVWYTPANNDALSRNSLPMFPAKIVIDNVRAGVTVDTATQSQTNPDNPDYYTRSGEPLTVNIHNPRDKPVIISVTYSPCDRVTDDADTGLLYQPAARIVANWVQIADDKVVIPARSIAHVPVRLSVPGNLSGIDLPDRWEFRISIIETTQKGMFQTETLQRWLVSMRKS